MNKILVAMMLTVMAACSRDAAIAVGGHGQQAGKAGIASPADARSLVGLARRTRSGSALASMPDRGELLAFPEPTEAKRDGPYIWRRIGVSEEHAFRAVAKGSLRVRTPSGELLDVVYDRHEEHASGDWTWVGHLPEQPGVQTILTFGAKAVFGSIGQPGERSLRVTTKGGSAWMVETDPGLLSGAASAAVNPSRPDHLAVPKVRPPQGAASIASPNPQAEAAVVSTAAVATAAATTIDVVIGYTPGFVTENGGGSAALTRLNYLVAVANQALVNSQVDVGIRLVHSLSVNYTDSTTNESTLEQLTGYDVSQQTYITPNAAFNALRAAREQYGADLVTLVRGFRDPEHDGCGIAWLIGGGRSGVAPGDGQDYFGYSVLSDGDDLNEGDGNTYFCRDESFVHELAHNMGSQHDRESAEGGDGTLDPDDYGVFTYSFGMKTGASAGNFFTVMAYGDDGQVDYRVFSNPRITFCGARACGTTQFEDNARSLGQTAPVIAGFRPTVVPNPGAGDADDDFNGDGMSDLLWRHMGNGSNAIWQSAERTDAVAMQRIGDLMWTVVGIGDFDADGTADILWRNQRTGANAIWYSGNYANGTSLVGVTDLRWKVVGVGDFNADNRADILWRHSQTGANAIWPSAVYSQRYNLTTIADLKWQVVGTGDVDADGFADILWRNAGSGANAVWNHGEYSMRQNLVGVSDLGWKVVGVADFDADGRDDLLWRHAARGDNALWPGASYPERMTLVRISNLGWVVEATGDYDGDGEADIAWRHAGTGANAVWPSASYAQRRNLFGVADLNWKVQPD